MGAALVIDKGRRRSAELTNFPALSKAIRRSLSSNTKVIGAVDEAVCCPRGRSFCSRPFRRKSRPEILRRRLCRAIPVPSAARRNAGLDALRAALTLLVLFH